MDRPVPDSYRHRRRVRAVAVVIGGAALVVVLAVLVLGWVRPSVRRDRLHTGRVERGAVEATVSAAGTVVPLYEHLVTSPIDTRVERRLVAPGDTVAQGEAVVLLDVGATELALQRLDDQIALKRNERERARLELEAQLGSLRAQRDVGVLGLKSAEFEAARNREYYDQGLFSLDEVRRAETAVERDRIEVQRLEDSLAGAERLHAARLAGLALEIAILDKDRQEAALLLQQARPAAGRAGVVTWVIESEGAAVRRGDAVARIADLSAFGVEATLSDVHATRARPGLPVTVATGELRLGGRIGAVRPTVENGLLTLEIALDMPSHPSLRNHLRVDVHVVTDRHEATLRVPRGSFLNLGGRSAVFVVQGDVARRTYVELGLASFESFEVLAGLAEGDEVVLSDMSDHRDLEEVRLR